MFDMSDLINPDREKLYARAEELRHALFQWVFETKKVTNAGKGSVRESIFACLHNGVDPNDPTQERMLWHEVETQIELLEALVKSIEAASKEKLNIRALALKRREVIAQRGDATHAGGGEVKVYTLPEAKGPYAEKFGATSKYHANA
jgi:hypothetical protein